MKIKEDSSWHIEILKKWWIRDFVDLQACFWKAFPSDTSEQAGTACGFHRYQD